MLLRHSLLILMAAAMIFLDAAQGATLKVDRPALHQIEDGPVLAAAHEFVAGETVFFSCFATGYQIQEKDEERSVRLSWNASIRDAEGILLAEPKSGTLATRILPEDKEWRPKFRYQFLISPYALTGAYRLTVEIKDELSGSSVKHEQDIRVRGSSVAPTDTLTVKNLRFYRSEDDPRALTPAVFRPGDVMWAKFDITGFKLGERNRYAVEYGIAVLRESGEQMFEQPDAAAENGESFYPRRHVAGIMSLNLTKDLARIGYVLVITARDKVGGQTAEVRAAFRVE